jgi:hypothetical protein
MLGLEDRKPDNRLPEQGSTADLLAFSLVLPGATDPVEGMIEAARVELAALAEAAPSKVMADAINLIGWRMDVAMLLLARCDYRVPMPEEHDGEELEEPPPAPPEPPAVPAVEPAPKARKRRAR